MPNRFSWLLACTLLIAACGTRPVAQVYPEPLPSEQRASHPTLASEQSRLAGLFRGTPVSFVMQADGSLRTTVPRSFSFDLGAGKVKPPLAAVLDRLARSQLSMDSTLRVTAPPDPQARVAPLARDRALSIRDYLIARGISPTRLQTTGGAGPGDLVEIVIIETGR